MEGGGEGLGFRFEKEVIMHRGGVGGGGGFGCRKSLSLCLKLSGLSQGTAGTNMGSERQILTDLNPRSAP